MDREGQTDLYQAPNAELEPGFKPKGKLPAASRWRRVLNYVLDYVGMILLVMVLAVVLALIGAEDLLNRMESTPDLVLGLVATFIYYVPLEGWLGFTLGKLVTGTVVVTTQGGKPSFGAVIGRTFCRFIPFEAFSIFTRGRVCWHDQIPGTKVVEREVLRRWHAGERVDDAGKDDALPVSDRSDVEDAARSAD